MSHPTIGLLQVRDIVSGVQTRRILSLPRQPVVYQCQVTIVLLWECVACEPPYYRPTTGQRYCIRCPDKTYPLTATATSCVPVPGNYVLLWECVACEPPYYRPTTGQRYCIRCPDKTYPLTAAATSCVPVPGNYCVIMGVCSV